MLDKKKYPYKMECEITVIKVIGNKLETREVMEAVFPLSREAVKEPWYVLTNHLAPKYVEKKLGRQGTTWKRIYERKIKQIININDPTDVSNIPIRVQTYEQLTDYCKLKELPVKPKDFHTVELARRMVQLYIDDPKAYDLQYEQYKIGEFRQKPEFDDYRKSIDELVDAFEDETPNNQPKKNTAGKNTAGKNTAGKKKETRDVLSEV